MNIQACTFVYYSAVNQGRRAYQTQRKISKNLNIASLDIGFHNLKRAKTTATNVDQLRERLVAPEASDIELELFLYPASACPTRDLPHSIGAEIGGETVEINGEPWQGGVGFGLTPSINKDYSDAYKHTTEWKALLLTGLKRLGMKQVDCLVLGLPCDEFYNSATAVNDVVRLSKGIHKIDENLEVEVKHVIVLPQPLGSFHGYYLSEPDENIRKILKKAVTVVADPGYGTFDFVVINKGEHVLQQSAGSTRKSIRAVCLETARILKEKNPDLTLAPNDVEQCIVSKDWEIVVNSNLVNIEETFKQAADNVGKAAFKHLRTTLASSAINPQICILTAGGADVFKNIALKESGADKMLTSPYSIYLNVFGYLYEALKRKQANEW